jgi:NADH-quinone oxidoreductase subunit A
MLFDFANVAVFLMFSVGFVILNLLLSRVLAPRAPHYEKSIPYECGEMPVGSPWIRFNPRYYVIALIFVIFDVEVAFLIPCAVAFRSWVETSPAAAKIAFLEVGLFLLILFLGLVYEWKKGYIHWVQNISDARKATVEPGRPQVQKRMAS